MAFCGFLRESPQITHPSLSRDLCRDRFLPQTWTLNSGFVLLLLQIFPGAAMPRCCEATVLIKRVGISTHTHTSCVSPTQSDLRWDQSSDELQVGTGKIRSLDGDRSGAGWQGGLASISVPPPLLCAPRWRAARRCVARRKTALSGAGLPRPLGTECRTQPSTVSSIHLQLSVICGLPL